MVAIRVDPADAWRGGGGEKLRRPGHPPILDRGPMPREPALRPTSSRLAARRRRWIFRGVAAALLALTFGYLPYHIGARVAFEVHRALRASWGFSVVGAMVYLLGRGWFPDLRMPGADWGRAAAAALLATVLATKVSARLRTSERRRTPWREVFSDIELGLLLLAATYVFLSILGGVTSPVYPLVYALVSFLVTFHRLAVGIPLAVA